MVSFFLNTRSPVSCRQIYAPNYFRIQQSVRVLNGWLDLDFIQLVRQNTINSWDYMNSLRNKWIIEIIYYANSHVNLNKVGTSSIKRKCHCRYYIHILVSTYLSLNWQERLTINEAGLRSMEQKRYQRVLPIFKSQCLKYSKYLESECKFELSISNEMWQHVFRSGVGSYIFTFLGYVPGLYFVSYRMW